MSKIKIILIIKSKREPAENLDFFLSADRRVKTNENKKRHKYLDLAEERLEKVMEHNDNDDIIYNWISRNNLQRVLYRD